MSCSTVCFSRNMTLSPTCRLCLSTEGIMEDIFSSSDHELQRRIYECTSIEITNFPGLPSCICEVCKSKLGKFQKFRQLCINSDEILKSKFPELFRDIVAANSAVEPGQPIGPIEYFEITYKDDFMSNSSEQHQVKSSDEQIYPTVNVYGNNDIKPELGENNHEFETSFFKSKIIKEEYDKEENESKAMLGNCIYPEEKEGLINQVTSDGNLATIYDQTSSTSNINDFSQKTYENSIALDTSDLKIGTIKEENDKESGESAVKPESGMIAEVEGSQVNKVAPVGNLVLKITDGNRVTYNRFCPICGKMTTSLKKHMLIHSEERPFECKDCGRRFRRKNNFQHHTYTHTGEKPYKCKLCERCFSVRSSLRCHMVAHTGERHHRCEICGKSFAHAPNLAVHLKIHTQDRRHKCEYCGKTFIARYALTKHIRTHTGEKPYTCEVCRKTFATTENLSSHKKTHPDVCTICDITFISKDVLIAHMKGHETLKTND